ncbi:hypothetical protein RhiirB3_456242 [Rhizophagus irregularis]|nr:hypothetical protein RhiirB3_456242 [Rhizophagus irregularis]
MVHFFVSVDEGQKNIISQQVIKIVEEICTFSEIYEAITEGVFGVCNVRVYVGKEDGKWNNLREGLYDDISLMSELELKEDTQREVLYNDVIALLKENQKNGWRVDQKKIAKIFIKQLVDLLCQYQCGSNYNKFYYTSHHKKESLKREKLEQLAESLELSIGQPWASEAKWTDFILEYHQGNYLGTLNYIWKALLLADQRLETENAQYSLIKKVTPVMLQTLYYDLTGDASTTLNPICKEKLKIDYD